MEAHHEDDPEQVESPREEAGGEREMDQPLPIPDHLRDTPWLAFPFPACVGVRTRNMFYRLMERVVEYHLCHPWNQRVEFELLPPCYRHIPQISPGLSIAEINRNWRDALANYRNETDRYLGDQAERAGFSMIPTAPDPRECPGFTEREVLELYICDNHLLERRLAYGDAPNRFASSDDGLSDIDGLATEEAEAVLEAWAYPVRPPS